MDAVETVREYYNKGPEAEWNRIEGRPEFLLTCRFLDRYIKKGDTVLDIGGGPGRYSFYLAQKDCDVTLFDLPDGNIDFARRKAAELGLGINTVCGDARYADQMLSVQFDHVLLMGPMYHLPEERDRIKATEASLKLLKDGGTIFASFINMFANILYAMKYQPDIVGDPVEQAFYRTFIENRSFSGMAFTQSYFAKQDGIIPFMARFPLEKLHFFGQEGILSPCESTIMSRPGDVVSLWLDLCEKICEREDLLSWSEHLMYIGRKIK